MGFLPSMSTQAECGNEICLALLPALLVKRAVLISVQFSFLEVVVEKNTAKLGDGLLKVLYSKAISKKII